MRSEQLHQAQSECPVCGSATRSTTSEGLARDKVPEYLRALSEDLNLRPQDLCKPMQDFRCANCGVVYIDPSLSDRALNRLYLTSAPIHNAGWANFTKRVLGYPRGESEIEQLEQFVRTRLGYPQSYLEVGCPFSGLALMWADQKSLRDASHSGVGERRYSDKSYLPIQKIALRTHRFATRASDLVVRGWLGVDRLRGKGSRQGEAQCTTRPRLSFLAEFSVNRWSAGCRAFGRSCTEIASVGMGMEILSRQRLKDLPLNTFQLAGVINALDHSDRPMELLLEVVRVSQSTLVAGHRIVDAYLQHRFAFSDDTVPRLAAMAGLECEDLSSGVGAHASKWFVFMLTKPNNCISSAD